MLAFLLAENWRHTKLFINKASVRVFHTRMCSIQDCADRVSRSVCQPSVSPPHSSCLSQTRLSTVPADFWVNSDNGSPKRRPEREGEWRWDIFSLAPSLKAGCDPWGSHPAPQLPILVTISKFEKGSLPLTLPARLALTVSPSCSATRCGQTSMLTRGFVLVLLD